MVALIGAVAGLAAGSAPGNVPGGPRVTIIGDSVATGMLWHPDAIAVLERGLNVDWQVAVCRRVTGVSCPFEGETVPSLVDLVPTLGTVSPIVVVEMGYNDFESTFAAGIDASVQVLLAHGAQHILWLTLRAVRHPYVRMNEMLSAAAKRYPQLELVDWNRYSRSHPDWFQGDGEHLVESGGVAMATLMHLAVDEVTDPLRLVPPAAVPASVGRIFSLRFQATGGEPPYRFSLVGSPPRGLHLLADGSLSGTPRSRQRVAVLVRVTDTEGQTAAMRVVLAVR